MMISKSPAFPSASQPGKPAAQTTDRWDRIAHYSLLTAIFFSGWNILRVGSINLTFSDIALLVCLIIIAVRGRMTTMPFGSLTPFWLMGLVMMLGGLFVGSVVNGDPLRWINIALQYSVSLLLIPMVLMQQDERTRSLAPLLFVLGTVLSQIIGIGTTLLFTPVQTTPWMGNDFYTGNMRLGSMAGEPNSNGAAVAFAFPMLIYVIRKRQIPWIVSLACLVLLGWGLLLTASFSGFAATLLTVLICLLMLGGFAYAFRLGLVGGIAVALFLASGAPLPQAFQQRVGTALESGDISKAGTFMGRSQLIEEAWTFTEYHSVIGMGVDRYRQLSAHDNPVHNLYLLIWNEGGIVAFAGLIMLLTLLVLLATGGPRDRERKAPAVAVLLVFLMYTTSYPHMYSRMWIMPVMVMLALLYTPRRKAPPTHSRFIYASPAGPPHLLSF